MISSISSSKSHVNVWTYARGNRVGGAYESGIREGGCYHSENLADKVASTQNASYFEKDNAESNDSEPVDPGVFNGNLGSLTNATEWRPGDPIKIIPEGDAEPNHSEPP